MVESLPNSNLEPSGKRLANVCKRIERDEKLNNNYDEAIEKQLESGIIEGVPVKQNGERVYHIPHKHVVREEANKAKDSAEIPENFRNFGLVGNSSENPWVLNDGKEREDMNEETEEHENTPERLRKLKSVTAEETKEGQGDEDENASDNSDQDETFELMNDVERKREENEVENLQENGIKTKGKMKSNVVSQGNTKETSSVEKTSERKKKKRKITDESRMKEKLEKNKKAKLVKSGTDEDNMQTGDLDEKNRGRWMKGKVVKYVKGKDSVIRGVIVLHKGNYLERPVRLVCPLEIRSVVKEDQGRHNESTEDNDDKLKKRPERKAAKIAKVNIREQLKDD
ncbi:Hypothetical predicted protein [Paramuricea clavata]|uniref:Uncharacterized protein n=1 Tax=Paramuricea clavata TaxID=317549 RepID=A0A7D9F0G0_PARCT|nr:Hypothetical predicted protein [Paramuricea clavata]